MRAFSPPFSLSYRNPPCSHFPRPCSGALLMSVIPAPLPLSQIYFANCVKGLHTDEDTISLLRRLAVHYPDDVIAGILNRQGRKTASGERFTANQFGSLR